MVEAEPAAVADQGLAAVVEQGREAEEAPGPMAEAEPVEVGLDQELVAV